MAPTDTKKAEQVSFLLFFFFLVVSVNLEFLANIRVQAKQGPPKLSDYKEILDESTFEQILEMDDDEEDRDFSKSIVYGFFDQAENTYKKMEKEL